jgi:preprotein translocase subunit SecY
MAGFRFTEWMRRAAARSRAVAVVFANVVMCEVGARIGLPGVDSSRVTDFIRGSHLGLLGLYNFLVGGAISRAAVLALGAIPYVQARLYLWLGRKAFPTLERATRESATKRSVIRIATASLAAVQAFGFARFLENIPGAVAEPGVGFIIRTVLLLTGGAAAVGWLAELIVGPATADTTSDVLDDHTLASPTPTLNPSTVPNGDAGLPEMPTVLLLESGAHV